MGSKKIGAVKELSEVVAPVRNDDLLASLDGEKVEVALTTIREQDGPRGKYKVTFVTLSDGRVFSVFGKPVADVFVQVPSEAYPLRCTFRSQPSGFDPDGIYWTVQ